MSEHPTPFGVMGGDQDLAQGGGLLSNLSPGDRLQNVLGGKGGPDLGQSSGADMPSNPGPALAGRTPLVGTVRRQSGMPVLRDQLSEAM